MVDWRIKDYEDRCYNLLIKLGAMPIAKGYLIPALINKNVKRIRKAIKCDRLQALRIYKAELSEQLASDRITL